VSVPVGVVQSSIARSTVTGTLTAASFFTDCGPAGGNGTVSACDDCDVSE
jgi:hypothetical protein